MDSSLAVAVVVVVVVVVEDLEAVVDIALATVDKAEEFLLTKISKAS